ncbi:aminotransferase class I/II-fold pyridoxal phosphate-dependent enzyme [Gephyromycinifex aptenodytis]|uniref:aminotransferase class I/II-fold pyridoxal phosphate-dependent enzyme n=1 Tax=Gephyromycinifex aptenodytis TaxID=2716227 RepID=UPI001D00A8E2|nr:aminotransferase class I/II-fold pyridoxal phosphate-dependent enzyme [Gephyromycinifex aptenodytis]
MEHAAQSPLIEAMQPFTTTIFSEMSALAARLGAVNLGQGFPDEQGPDALVEAACKAIRDGHNQYAPGTGIPQLREAISEHQQRFYGLDLDPAREVLVTVGATEAVAAAILALVSPGDEVVTFAPYFDSYPVMTARAGGILRTCPLSFPDGDFDRERLAAIFSDRTRLVILNTPHNPTGKVFSRDEMEFIAELALRHDAWILTDEVYEHLILDEAEHIPMACLGQVADRTLTVSSAGKTFSMTGWKVGWVSGPAAAVAAVTAVKQFLTFTASGPFQYAVAEGLRQPVQAYSELASRLRRRRDFLRDSLQGLGLATNNPAATYFLLADFGPLGVSDAAAQMPEFAERVGVVGIPVSAFHLPPPEAYVQPLVRLAFCKRDEVLQEAMRRLGTVSGAPLGS